MTILLELEQFATGYDRVEVLHGVSVEVPEGAVVAVLGPNGAGKTTLLRSVAGLMPGWRGEIRLAGRRIDGCGAYRAAREGVTLIPEGRGVFPGLSVRENLEIAGHAARGMAPEWRRQAMAELVGVFPRLAERSEQRAGTLSGGEQQMLALSRALLAAPRVLLIDELSMGLAPVIVEQLFERVAELKRRAQTIVLVEQYLTHALDLADVCYVLQQGRVVFAGEPEELRDSSILSGAYLGVSSAP